MAEQNAAPGWYDDGQGKQRWWTGKRWSLSWAAANDSARHGLSPWVTVLGVLFGALIVFAVAFGVYEMVVAWDNSWNSFNSTF